MPTTSAVSLVLRHELRRVPSFEKLKSLLSPKGNSAVVEEEKVHATEVESKAGEKE